MRARVKRQKKQQLSEREPRRSRSRSVRLLQPNAARQQRAIEKRERKAEKRKRDIAAQLREAELRAEASS